RAPAQLVLECLRSLLEGVLPGLPEVWIGVAQLVEALAAKDTRGCGRVPDRPAGGEGLEERLANRGREAGAATLAKDWRLPGVAAFDSETRQSGPGGGTRTGYKVR